MSIKAWLLSSFMVLVVTLSLPAFAVEKPVDCSKVDYLATECNVPYQESRVRAGEVDVGWDSFKITYAGGLTAAQLDGVAKALNVVLGAQGTLTAASFDAAPGSGVAGFTSPPSSIKVFFRKAVFSDDTCVVTFGSVGANGSMTCAVEGEYTTFGTPPAIGAGNNYVIAYAPTVMAALLAADPNATAANFNVFVTQLFACMTAAKEVGDSGSGCVVGADTPEAGGIFGKFKMSKTTGSWSYSGAPRTTYVTAAAP
jgi:hypothetical protein